jgi:glycosyltransferase involved in cell wall biosynthesis
MRAFTSRCDVHVHSKHSDRPSEWLLRRIGAPESFVEPRELYERARARGMDFVTISDHNCIRGALEIAELPGVFLSSEITTYFPEDGCKIHCLVLGVTEAQFAAIQELRENIYDFQRYLVEQDIVHSVAHPLFRVNDRLTPAHLEKLILLFKRFEAINGTRDDRASELVNVILRSLAPDDIERLADLHGLEPLGPEPWIKTFTAGSDDHSGIYIANAYTVTPPAAGVAEFLDHFRRGEQRVAGKSGSSLLLAHSFYQIAYSFYRLRFLRDSRAGRSLLGELLQKLWNRPEATKVSFIDQVVSAASSFVDPERRQSLSPADQALVDEFTGLLEDSQQKAHRDPHHLPTAAEDRNTFHLAARLSQQLAYTFFERFAKYAAQGRLMESLQTLASLGPVALSVSPYLAAFQTQHKDERFLQEVAAHFPVAADLRRKSDRKAWITDTFLEINGVTRTIQSLARVAQQRGQPLTLVTCLAEAPDTDLDLANFRPLGKFRLPEYESQELSVPPALELLEYFERQKFCELIISTPGPLGLAALAAGRLLGLHVTGIYHTDFPHYVQQLTQDDRLEALTWRYMQWFFGQVDTLFVPSEYYRGQLTERGFDPARLRLLRRGVDSGQFSPQRRDPEFWRRHGLPEGFKYLYVGRMSREKNLDLLLAAFAELRRGGTNAQLAMVGDGPAAEELRSAAGKGVFFLGQLEGDELAAAYATSDVFVFPSTSDTFGNAVLEAQASGLPAIVSVQGGPVETIGRFDSGLAVDVRRPGALAEAMQRLFDDEPWRRRLSERALDNALSSDWDGVFADLWDPRPTAAAPAELPGPAERGWFHLLESADVV